MIKRHGFTVGRAVFSLGLSYAGLYMVGASVHAIIGGSLMFLGGLFIGSILGDKPREDKEAK